MKFSRIFAALAAIVPCFVHAANYAYVPSGTNYVLTPGQTQVVSIYITETTDGVESSLIASQLGLYSAEVRVALVSSDATTPAKILSTGDVTVDNTPGNFDAVPLGNEIVVGPTNTDIAAFADAGRSSGVLGQVVGNVTTIKVADVLITAGTQGITKYQLIDVPGGDNTVTFDTSNSTALDSFFASTGPEVTINVIPEPSSIATILAAWPLVVRRRRNASC